MSVFKPGGVYEVVKAAVEKVKGRERTSFYSSLTGGCSEAESDGEDEFSSALDPGTAFAAGIRIKRDDLEAARTALEHDVAHFKKIHGPHIGVHYDEGTKQYTIRLALPLTFLSRFQLESLFLSRTKRLVMELSWAWNYFEASEIPRIKNIYLTSEKSLDVPDIPDKDDSFGVVKWYIQNRFEHALRINWLTRKEERMKALQFGGTDVDGRGVDFTRDELDVEDAEELSNAVKQYTLQPSDLQEIKDKAVMLTKSGWSLQAAYMALHETGLRVDKADAWLGTSSSVSEKAKRRSVEEWLEGCKELKIKSMLCSAEQPTDTQFNKSIRFTAPCENFFENGCTNVLNGIIRYLKYRMYSISQNCVICDKRLGFECVKTAVCNRPTCGFALEQYGLGCNPLAEIQRSSNLVDLMVTLAGVAIQSSSSTSRDSFNPWCENIEVSAEYLKANDLKEYLEECEKSGSLHFRGNGKNWQLISKVLNKIPKVAEMASCTTKTELRGILDARHPLCYPLLQWIISSNRSCLLPIEKKLQLKGLGDNQWILCSSDPEKERRFRTRRAKMKKKNGGTGSFWAWHGSGSGNWHAILRLGLKNYSNTSMMSAGAAHGPGIYLAKDISTSIGYMREAKKGWANSALLGDSITCIALCEVVDERKEQNTKCHDHGGIYVVEDEDLVSTRFFFVFPAGYNGDRSIQGDVITKPKALLELFEE
eukprot:TRINITY_DN10282_c0_g1_i1.p1 TRINITY_DN10282_c0_g1~~TRINITY_DN10282_c0_g1_i1.p1  ORF type:complete len:782 (+),score=148.22 TRINITY_DN10282_c0_g1_i1:231-2348(+)